jgi:hypothetical protein
MDLFTQRNIYAALAAFAVIAVLAAATALWNGSNTQLEVTDIATIVTNMQTQYQPASYQYGTAAITPQALAATLDSNIVTGTGNTTQINTRWNSPITITGSGSSFTLAFGEVGTANCQAIEQSGALAQVLTSIQVTGGTARTTLPVTDPNTAAADCASAPNTMTLTAKGHPGT